MEMLYLGSCLKGEWKNTKRILVVDDEPDTSRIFKIALEDSGFEVDEFNNSTEALSAFKPHYYDVLSLILRCQKWMDMNCRKK